MSEGYLLGRSRREVEEDILEELCGVERRCGALTVEGVSGLLGMAEREVVYYLRQMKRHGYVEFSLDEGKIWLTELGRVTGEECIGMRRLLSFCSLWVLKARLRRRMPAGWNISSVRKRFARSATL